MPVSIASNDNHATLFDNPPAIVCPHCAVKSAVVPISIPRYELIRKFQLREVGIVGQCSSCHRAVFMLHKVIAITTTNIDLSDEFAISNRVIEPFEMQYLSGAVLADFHETLTCYSTSSWNAFDAMSRRCIQSISAAFGAEDTSKVQNQLKELEAMGVADAETFAQLHEIMLSGHDGAHPHLPSLSADRAEVLLHLMKDVLYQLYVRPAKIRESSELRKKAIASKSSVG
jgi:hypothetical protein